MSRAVFFVFTCAFVIIALFGVFCFLISTVNPPPLNIDESKTSKVADEKLEKSGTHYLANFYLRNMEPMSEILEYGLEKAYDYPGLQSSSPASKYQRFNHTNLIPEAKFKNPNLVRVYPPIWPPVPTKHTTPTSSKKIQNVSIGTTKSTTKKHGGNKTANEIVTTSESPIHRRSINAIEKSVDAKTGSVILKIIDDDGQPRIEIKLNPNEIFETKSRMHRSSLLNDSKLSMFIEEAERGVDIKQLPVNTEIMILPNDTILIENDVHSGNSEKNNTIPTNDTKYHVDNTGNISKIISTVDNKTEATTIDGITSKTEEIEFTTQNSTLSVKMDIILTDIINTTTTDTFELKMLIDNVTTLVTEPYNEISGNKTI